MGASRVFIPRMLLGTPKDGAVCYGRVQRKSVLHRVVTKISSCWVNMTSRRGIKWLGISFGSIFLLFSNKSSWGPLS